MARIAVMGSGSWGTAFAMVLADAGADVALWGLDEDVADQINSTHINEVYHPGIVLPTNIVATVDAREALTDAQMVILALKAQTLRTNLAALGAYVEKDAMFVSPMKGIVLGTNLRMIQ